MYYFIEQLHEKRSSLSSTIHILPLPIMSEILVDMFSRRTEYADYAIYLFILVNAFSGIRMVTNPLKTSRAFGHKGMQLYSPTYIFFTGCGYTLLSTALVLVLLVASTVPLEKAIPYGLLFRAFWVKKCVDRDFDRAGITPSQKIKIIFMICGPGSALLLMVRRVDLLSVEMNITSAIVMVASLIFFVPNLGAPWLFGINVSSKGKSKERAMIREFGRSSIVDGTLMTLLILDVGVSDAVGYTCVLRLFTSIFSGYIVRADRELGINQKHYLFDIILSFCFAVALINFPHELVYQY